MSVFVDVSSVMQVEEDCMVIPLPEDAVGKVVKLQFSAGKVMIKLRVTNWGSDRIEGITCTGVPDDEVLEDCEVDPGSRSLLMTLSYPTLGALSMGRGIITLIDLYR
ncbi:hypothetical protein DIPPA_28304 [Diplonema papillatum]|nr:hypothetical protein DIPPA_28304 [Diplonema papillatum]